MINCSDTNRRLSNYHNGIDNIPDNCPECGNTMSYDMTKDEEYCAYCEKTKQEFFEENYE